MLVFAGRSQLSPPCNSRFQRSPPLISPDFPGFLENIAKLKRQETLYHEHGGRRYSIVAGGEIISRRRETLYHRATRHSITAARHTLSPRHDTLYHRGTRHSITAARDNLSRRHERLYHGGRRDCITAARDTVSRRQERFYHGEKKEKKKKILSRRQARLHHDHSGRRDSIPAVR